MSSKHSPGKVTLGMLKGKPITTSVPVIRYHASDDELEVYQNSDDEKQQTPPDSEKVSPKSSPSKNSRSRTEIFWDVPESNFDKSSTVENNLSEGTPPTDPWKVFSDIRGKITKTFEEKLSEMKSDNKRRKRSKENSSLSDSEDICDITPTEENSLDLQEKEKSQRGSTNKLAGFSNVKIGLKTKNSEEDSIESGVEAAEYNESIFNENDKTQDKSINEDNVSHYSSFDNISLVSKPLRPETIIFHIKNQLIYQFTYYLVIPFLVLFFFNYLIPLPEYFQGLVTGICVTFGTYCTIKRMKNILTTPLEDNNISPMVSVINIPTIKEHVAVEKFEGWLNELPSIYDPDNYHVARTKSIFFKLEGSTLIVLETRTKMPKRAMWDEPKHKFKFNKKRIYNMAGAKVELLPTGLIRLRRWSKKYPICITFDKEVRIENTSKGSSDEEPSSITENNNKCILEDEETDDDISQSKSLKDIFEDCSEMEDGDDKCKIYVFARTDRQKEDWYRRLVSAANIDHKHSISSINEGELSLSSLLTQTNNEIKNSEVYSELYYDDYMAQYIDNDTESDTNQHLWFNCLIGRLFFDMRKSPDTINFIQDKIQRKLSNIKLPYFMESLLVSDIVIGQGAPVIHRVTSPTINERGLWLDLDIAHKGCLTMTIETKLNLMKLTKTNLVTSNPNEKIHESTNKATKSPMFDSDVEDSPETSTEDEDSSSVGVPNASKETTSPSVSSGKKFLSMVDKLAANKYFQHATEFSYIRRAMEEVSNTEIRLMVNVSGIEGCVSLNIPTSPSDRVWYGFKPLPKITITVKPALGERAVNIVYVTKWIEAKLLREFEKIAVLPNMDDLVIPLCPNYPYI